MALAEEEHGTDLVPASGALAAVAQIEEIERLLPEALERGDTDFLLNVARKADVAALWAKREGYREEANRVLRLKIRAEACVGLVDLENHPAIGKGFPALSHGDEVIAPYHRRVKWRLSGVALQRGCLEEAMDAVERRGETLRLNLVADELVALGAPFVPHAAIQPLVEAYMDRTGAPSRQAVVRELGFTGTWRAALFPSGVSRRPGQAGEPRLRWTTAVGIARSLGADPSALPYAPVIQRKRTHRAPRWLTRERKPSKGPAGAAYTLFRQTLAEISTFAPNAVTKYDDIYAHLYAVEEFLAKEMKREGMG